jgi:hypothetical protein
VPKDEFCKTNPKVDGCCDSICQQEKWGSLTSEKKCRTRVRNQVAKVHRPVFLEMNIEKDCPINEWFMHNIELCEKCSKYHQPCSNTHMACGGCCGTPWHSQLGLNINVEHTCEDIQAIFLATNSYTAECEFEEVDDDSEAGEITFEDETPLKHWLDEVITAKCTSDINQVVCQKSPLKVKFECDDCQNQGSPVLMKKCCDRCVEFAENLASNTKIPDFVKPIVWCSSCDDEYIYPEDREKFSPMPWDDHVLYAQYTEAKADEQFLGYIKDEICPSMKRACPAAEDRRLRGQSDQNSSACLAMQPNCTTQEELYESVTQGRRMLDMEKVDQVSGDAVVQVASKTPELVCDELDYIVNPARYPRSSMTTEQTATATTMSHSPVVSTTDANTTESDDVDSVKPLFLTLSAAVISQLLA